MYRSISIATVVVVITLHVEASEPTKRKRIKHRHTIVTLYFVVYYYYYFSCCCC